MIHFSFVQPSLHENQIEVRHHRREFQSISKIDPTIHYIFVTNSDLII